MLVARASPAGLGACSKMPSYSCAIPKDKILATQGWQDKYDKYDPPADVVDALKTKIGADMKIDVYLGLWCPDSRNHVPPFLKILDRLGTSPQSDTSESRKRPARTSSFTSKR
jgi:hypothetical protein